MTRPQIRSYGEAAAFLGWSPKRQTGQRGTSIVRLDFDTIAVRYHQTQVVTYYSPLVADKVATIDNGGWITPTTENRINEYAPEGYSVCRSSQNGIDFMWLWLPDGTNVLLLEPYHIPRQHSNGKGVLL